MRARRYRLGAIAVGLLGASPFPALAADLAAPPPPPPPPAFVATNWAGLYIGLHTGGFVSGSSTLAIPSPNGGPPGLGGAPNGGNGGGTGFVVGTIDGPTTYQGLHAGYNLQFGAFVVGVEGDVKSLGRIEDMLGGVRGRFGYAYGPALFYGTAGVAFQSISGGLLGGYVGGNGGNGGNGGAGAVGGGAGGGGSGFGQVALARGQASRTGFVGGGGMELRLSRDVSAGIEALYYGFDNSFGPGALNRDAVAINGRLTYYLGEPLANVAFVTTPAAWDGVYGGLNIGAVHHLSQSTIDTASLAPGVNGAAGGNGAAGNGGGGGGGGGGAMAFAAFQRYAAFIGGAHVGYNWQMANLVLGGEGGVSFSTNEAHALLADIRGRAGWAAGPYLLYATGGVAFNVNDTPRGIFAGNGGNGGNGAAAAAGGAGGAGGLGGLALAIPNTGTRVGFVVGGGLESKISERISLGVEGLYYEFGRSGTPFIPTGGRGVFSDGRDDAIVLRSRLSYRWSP